MIDSPEVLDNPSAQIGLGTLFQKINWEDVASGTALSI